MTTLATRFRRPPRRASRNAIAGCATVARLRRAGAASAVLTALATLVAGCSSDHLGAEPDRGGDAGGDAMTLVDAATSDGDAGARRDVGAPTDARSDVAPDAAPAAREASVDDAAAEGAASTDGCVPACAGNACGPDGCNGTCGTCAGEATCQSGQCVEPVCAGNCGAQEKCGWDPYAHGGTGAFDCIPEGWTTKDCAKIGGIGTCDFGGDLARCTSTGLIQTVCADGCGLYASAECGPLAGCITCSRAPEYCGGVSSAPICQGDVRIVCYDNGYDLEWCPATGKTCQCPQGICACQ